MLDEESRNVYRLEDQGNHEKSLRAQHFCFWRSTGLLLQYFEHKVPKTLYEQQLWETLWISSEPRLDSLFVSISEVDIVFYCIDSSNCRIRKSSDVLRLDEILSL